MESPAAELSTPYEKRLSGEKGDYVDDVKDVGYTKERDSESLDSGSTAVLQDERDIATHVISIEDDSTLSPWTFLSLVLGMGLSAFGGVLGEIPSSLPSTLG